MVQNLMICIMTLQIMAPFASDNYNQTFEPDTFGRIEPDIYFHRELLMINITAKQ